MFIPKVGRHGSEQRDWQDRERIQELPGVASFTGAGRRMASSSVWSVVQVHRYDAVSVLGGLG